MKRALFLIIAIVFAGFTTFAFPHHNPRPYPRPVPVYPGPGYPVPVYPAPIHPVPVYPVPAPIPVPVPTPYFVTCNAVGLGNGLLYFGRGINIYIAGQNALLACQSVGQYCQITQCY
ncbi:MAG: hypothetical protein KDD45_02250 [Bdellovibrionales bacterium]|nr:hypothetical protein [Bdellovibrionales bacterium]